MENKKEEIWRDREEQDIITEFLKRKLIKLESQINKYGYTMNNFFDE